MAAREGITPEGRRSFTITGGQDRGGMSDLGGAPPTARQFVQSSIDDLESQHQKQIAERNAILEDAASIGASHSQALQFLKAHGLDNIKEPEGLKEFRKAKVDILREQITPEEQTKRETFRGVPQEEGAELTPQQQQIRGGIAGGVTPAEISAGIAKPTIPEHEASVVSQALDKGYDSLGVEAKQIFDKKYARDSGSTDVSVKARNAAEASLAVSKTVSERVDKALGLIESGQLTPTGAARGIFNGLEKITGGAIDIEGFGTTGILGNMLAKIPGTDASDVKDTIATIQANLGFEELKKMKMASKTGGALGQVTVREIEFLQATIANLQSGQSAELLMDNLKIIKEKYLEMAEKIRMGMEEEDRLTGISPKEVSQAPTIALQEKDTVTVTNPETGEQEVWNIREERRVR